MNKDSFWNTDSQAPYEQIVKCSRLDSPLVTTIRYSSTSTTATIESSKVRLIQLLRGTVNMARLSSAFESRPEPGSILALLEANGSDARHLANTAIGLAQRESLFAANPFYGPEVEPLPVIDYHLLSILINLCRPNLSIKELKRFDYLADSRGFYYRAHHDFEYFYRGLQDVFACGVILDQQKQQLELSGPSKLRELEWNHIARIKNLEEKERVLENLQQRRKAREQCTAWFSAMKLDFINSDMPRLLYVGKHVYQKAHIPGIALSSFIP